MIKIRKSFLICVFMFIGVLVFGSSNLFANPNRSDSWIQFEFNTRLEKRGSDSSSGGNGRIKNDASSVYYKQQAMTNARFGDYCRICVKKVWAWDPNFATGSLKYSWVGQAGKIWTTAFETNNKHSISVLLYGQAPGQFGYTWYSGGAWSPDSF